MYTLTQNSQSHAKFTYCYCYFGYNDSGGKYNLLTSNSGMFA